MQVGIKYNGCEKVERPMIVATEGLIKIEVRIERDSAYASNTLEAIERMEIRLQFRKTTPSLLRAVVYQKAAQIDKEQVEKVLLQVEQLMSLFYLYKAENSFPYGEGVEIDIREVCAFFQSHTTIEEVEKYWQTLNRATLLQEKVYKVIIWCSAIDKTPIIKATAQILGVAEETVVDKIELTPSELKICSNKEEAMKMKEALESLVPDTTIQIVEEAAALA